MPRPRSTPVRTLVADILRTVPAARRSDRELLYRVLCRCGFDLPRARFMKLPNFDYLTRVKREILRENDSPDAAPGRVSRQPDPILAKIARWFGS
jgi:hypothetical protein